MIPQDPEEVSALRERAESIRTQAREQREQNIHERRELLAALDPSYLTRAGIHDIEAAARCPSSAHPAPGHAYAPDRTCSCQEPEGDRRTRTESLLDALQQHSAELAQAHAREQEALKETAGRLGAVIEQAGGAAPYQILGSVDGVRFYLRERHGEWTLQVPDEEAGSSGDPCGTRSGTYLVAEGHADELYDPEDPARPLKVAVEEVRAHVHRTFCAHPDARSYCPDCGVHTASV